MNKGIEMNVISILILAVLFLLLVYSILWVIKVNVFIYKGKKIMIWLP